MVTTQKEHLLGVFELERHQKADYFKTLGTFVDIISKEEVVITTYVAIVIGLTPNVEEAH